RAGGGRRWWRRPAAAGLADAGRGAARDGADDLARADRRVARPRLAARRGRGGGQGDRGVMPERAQVRRNTDRALHAWPRASAIAFIGPRTNFANCRRRNGRAIGLSSRSGPLSWTAASTG